MPPCPHNGPIVGACVVRTAMPACVFCERDQLRIANALLTSRRDELLATIASLSQTVPLESEVAEALEQRGKLLAEIGTLRARRDELEVLLIGQRQLLLDQRFELSRLRPVYEQAKRVRAGLFSVKLKLDYRDRRLFDDFNIAVDTAEQPSTGG